MNEKVLKLKSIKSLIQLLEENISTITDIEKRHGFHQSTLRQDIQNLIIFNNQMKIINEDLSTPSKNRNRIITVLNHTQNLLSALKRLSKEKIIDLNNLLKFFKGENITFIHSLEDTLRVLRNHFLSDENRKKYGKYNGNLIFSCLEQLLSSLADAIAKCKKSLLKIKNLID